MYIGRVTITGADDSVDPEELISLHTDFPFVELGILFSKERVGQPRYPSREWLKRCFDRRVFSIKERYSAHLCGEYVTDLLQQQFTWVDDFDDFSHRFSRIQLNMSDELFAGVDLKQLAITTGRMTSPRRMTSPLCFDTFYDVILQSRNGFARAAEVLQVHQTPGVWYDMIYDASGGRGIVPDSFPEPVEGLWCGYAGGINPDNIDSVITELNAVCPEETSIWLDMETGVRDGEDFSLVKARVCLSIAKGRLYG